MAILTDNGPFSSSFETVPMMASLTDNGPFRSSFETVPVMASLTDDGPFSSSFPGRSSSASSSVLRLDLLVKLSDAYKRWKRRQHSSIYVRKRTGKQMIQNQQGRHAEMLKGEFMAVRLQAKHTHTVQLNSIQSLDQLNRGGWRIGHDGRFSRDPLSFFDFVCLFVYFSAGGHRERPSGIDRYLHSLGMSVQHFLCRPRGPQSKIGHPAGCRFPC